MTVELALYDSTGAPYLQTIMATESDYAEIPMEDGSVLYGICDSFEQVPAGDYYYGMTFAQDTQVIVATLTTGEKLECTVTVANNQFSSAKVSVDDCEYGTWGGNCHYAAYDKKGNLVVKVQVVNNNGYKRMAELKNVKLVVKDANGKVVGTYKQSKKAVSIL